MTSNFWRSVWTSVKVKSKKYFYFTDFFAKIYPLLTHVRKTPPLRSHYGIKTGWRTAQNHSSDPYPFLSSLAETYFSTQPDLKLFYLIFPYLWDRYLWSFINYGSNVALYIYFFSHKPAKVTSDFILHYLEKVIGGRHHSEKFKNKY